MVFEERWGCRTGHNRRGTGTVAVAVEVAVEVEVVAVAVGAGQGCRDQSGGQCHTLPS